MDLITNELKPKTKQLLATLEVVSEGLWYSSESYYPYTPFVWDSQSQGEFSIVRVLEHLGYFQDVEPEWLNKYWQSQIEEAKYRRQSDFVFAPKYPKIDEIQQMYERSSHFFQIFQENTLLIQVIKISASQILIIGQTQEEDWVGISPIVDYRVWYPRTTVYPEMDTPTAATISLKLKLEPLLSELKILNAYHWHDLVWENASTKEKLLLKLLISSKYIEIRDFVGLGQNNLGNFLLTNLQNVLTYTFSDRTSGFSIYIIGKTPENDFVGVHTTSIQT
ncbi:nuclease A inhibitor family protein [Nostoc sp.]|uniref:nuclease A inhibitor family protein n=1 Tax=Nostoc sp. TaxID=1180 RepID=UPI002FF32DEC